MRSEGEPSLSERLEGLPWQRKQLTFRDWRRRASEHLGELAELLDDRTARDGRGQRLAGIGRCPGAFRIVRNAGVESLGDPVLKLALADQGALAGGAGLD